MIVKNAAAVPLEQVCGVNPSIPAHADDLSPLQVLPVFVKALPLKRDFAESKPVVRSAFAQAYENLYSQTDPLYAADGRSRLPHPLRKPHRPSAP